MGILSSQVSTGQLGSKTHWVFLLGVRILTSLGGSGAHLGRDRACSPSMRGAEDLRHLRGGSGAQLGQDRAGMEQDCNHKEYRGNLLGGSGLQPPQTRALQGDHSEYPDHRASNGSHGICPDPRALHSTHGVYQGDRAFFASNPHHGDPRGSCLEQGHGGSGGFGGMSPIPTSWESSWFAGASRHREPTPVWRLDPLVRPCHEGLVKHRKPLVGPDGQTGSGALCGLEAGNTASTSSNRSMSSRRTSWQDL